MTRFIDSQTRRAPLLACKSALELFELDELGTSHYLLRGGAQRLDLLLADAITNTIQGMRNGVTYIAAPQRGNTIRNWTPRNRTDFSRTVPRYRVSRRARGR